MSRHYVHVSGAALAQILMSGFEAFVVKHQDRKRHAIEMHASLYGRTRETTSTLHHDVEFISVDTSADMNGGWVASRSEAESLKVAISGGFGFDMLGTIHTHPYLHHEMSLEEVRERGSQFSDGDLKCYREDLAARSGAGANWVLHAVLTIRNKDDENERQRVEKDGLRGDNVFEFSLANCKCFLNVQVFSLDDQEWLCREPTFLKCDDLQKFSYLENDFGYVSIATGKKRIVEHKP